MSTGAGIEGGIVIDLIVNNDRVTDVSITSSRPLQTPKIFIEKSVRQTLTTLPLLYSVCGTAQAQAAVRACEQAMALSPGEKTLKTRGLLLTMETAKEHLWRILMDWSALLGEQPDRAPVAEAIRLQSELRQDLDGGKKAFFSGVEIADLNTAKLRQSAYNLEALLQNSIYAMPTEQWLESVDEETLTSWAGKKQSIAARMLDEVRGKGWCGLGANEITALPQLADSDLHKTLATDEGDFIAAPAWAGRCHETSAYTRLAGHDLVGSLAKQYGNGLLPRLVARLVELAGLPAALHAILEQPEQETTPESAAEGVGMAQVEAARGRLVHRVELEGEAVRRYQIVAPTEWNFHPEGVLAKSLIGLEAGSEPKLQQQATLLINAIDPCVGYELKISYMG